MKATLNSSAIADTVVRELVNAIRARQEARGENLADANAYTIGYMASMMATILAESPKHRKYVLSTIAYVKENK